MFFKQIPLLLPLGSLIMGIYLGHQNYEGWIVFTVILLFAFSIIFCLRKSSMLKSMGIVALYFVLGFFLIHVNTISNQWNHFSNIQGESLRIKIIKTNPTKKGFQYIAKIKSVIDQSESYLSKGKLLLYSNTNKPLGLYAQYEIPSNYSTIDQFNNPGIFDYGSFLSLQNINHRAFLSKTPLQVCRPNALERAVVGVGNYIQNFFESNFQETRSSALVNAIFLGRKALLNQESKELFTHNGLAHLLAVSGMHVGIIFLILKIAFQGIPSFLIRQFLLITGIWFYIYLTGLQIPAVRAAFMFTFYLLGQVSNRNIKSLNSVFFAAMLLLAIEPKLIFQVSFQLSFSAMCSILIFYQPILSIFKFNQSWAKKCWQLTALNLSVQVFVLPITIFYFDQLPTYFLVTSLVSIPFIFVIIWGVILNLLLSSLAPISDFLCSVLEHLIRFYFSLLRSFAELPHSLIVDFNIHALQIAGWFLGIFVLYWVYVNGLKRKTLAFLGFIPLLMGTSVLKIQAREAKTITIYDTPKSVVMDIQYLGSTSRLLPSGQEEPFVLKNVKADRKYQYKENVIINIEHKKVLIIEDIKVIDQNKHADLCILLDSNVNTSLQNCSKVVIPRSNENSNIVNGYRIKENGSFTIKI